MDKPDAGADRARGGATGPAHGGTGHGPPPGETPRWLDDPKHVSAIFYALCVVCLGLLLVDVVHLYHKHAHFPFEELPGFHAGFGFLAYVGLVLTAKQLRRLLKRDEGYYD